MYINVAQSCNWFVSFSCESNFCAGLQPEMFRTLLPLLVVFQKLMWFPIRPIGFSGCSENLVVFSSSTYYFGPDPNLNWFFITKIVYQNYVKANYYHFNYLTLILPILQKVVLRLSEHRDVIKMLITIYNIIFNMPFTHSLSPQNFLVNSVHGPDYRTFGS